jgi:hypothetical protein
LGVEDFEVDVPLVSESLFVDEGTLRQMTRLNNKIENETDEEMRIEVDVKRSASVEVTD